MTGIRIAGGRPRLRNGKPATIVPGVAVFIPSAINVGLNGQSNMVHMLSGDSPQGLTTSTLAQESHDGVRSPAVANDPTGFFPLGTGYYGANGYGNNPGHVVTGGTNRSDAVAYFANQLTPVTNIPLVFYGYANIGTNIESWMADASSSNWTPFVNAVHADPQGAGLNCAIWYQGENNLGSTTAYYKGYLRRLHDQYLALSGMAAKDFYFGIVILGPSNGYSPGANDAAMIRQAQLEYIAENVGACMAASAADMNLTGFNGDGGIHITQASWERMARRYAKSIAAWAKGAPVKYPGPKVLRAARTGLHVDVAVQHASGTLLKDGAGGTGASAMGFRFFDDQNIGASVQIACTPVGIIGPNTIRLMLASAPVGALTMDHAMANLPYTATTDPATVIYDNDVVPGDTLGLPLQPCALMPVTVTGG